MRIVFVNLNQNMAVDYIYKHVQNSSRRGNITMCKELKDLFLFYHDTHHIKFTCEKYNYLKEIYKWGITAVAR